MFTITKRRAWRCSLLLIFFISRQFVFSQGCSDAGFCTMGAMRPNQLYSKAKNLKIRTLETSVNVAYTKFHDIITTHTLDANIAVSKRSFFQVKVPYITVSGKLAHTKGIGDISLSYTRSLYSNERHALNFSIGAKIPTNQSDILKDTLPLPMYYQTSLGTYDLITGLSWISSKWLFAVGYQMPIINRNQNEFHWTAWANNEKSNIALEYPQSWNLKRGNDVMIRVERNFRFSRFNFFTGLLPIYRINKDVIDFSQDPVLDRRTVSGSNGLVINALFGSGYQFSVQSGIKFLVGVKLKERDTNPDGLSRVSLATLSYIYRF